MTFFKRHVVTEGGGHLLITRQLDDPNWIRCEDFKKLFLGSKKQNKTADQQFEEFAILQGFGKICYTTLTQDSAKPVPNDMEQIAKNLRRLENHNEHKVLIDRWPAGRVDVFESDYHDAMIHMVSGDLIEKQDFNKKFWKYKAYRLFKPVLTFIEREWTYRCDECDVSIKEKDSPTHLIEWRAESNIIKARSVGSMATSFKRIVKLIQQHHGPINQVLLQNLDGFQGYQKPTTFYI